METDTYIVTGATGSIGRAIVAGLLERAPAPCRIVGAVRRPDALAQYAAALPRRDGVEIEAATLRLDSAASVRELAATAAARRWRVKALIHNAGTMPGPMILTGDGFEAATQTNFLAPALLTRLLLPLMTEGAVVVATTSMTRRIVRIRPDWDERSRLHHGRFTTYGRSKLMLACLATRLSEELAPRGIRANCTDPGIVDSAMLRMGNAVVDRLADHLFRPLVYTPAQGAAPALEAVFSPLTGHLFTLHSHSPLPRRWLRHWHVVAEAIDKFDARTRT